MLFPSLIWLQKTDDILRGTVFAFDIFETGFRQDTMSKEAGRRYRDMILRVGGSQPEMKTLRDYLGREPTTRPYLEWLGAKPRDI